MSPFSRPVLRQILVVGGVALAAWALGFFMGGGRGERGPSEPRTTAGSLSSVPHPGPSAIAAGQERGSGEQKDSGLLRHPSWTRDGLFRAGQSLARESSIITLVRHSMQIADHLEASDFPMAIEVGADLREEGKDMEVFGAIAMGRWAELDPQAAADYLLKRKDGSGFIDLDGDVVWSTFAAANPAAAAATARRLPNETERLRALRKIAETIARRDPAEAMAFAQANAPELLKGDDLSDALGEAGNAQKADETARQLAALGQDRKLDDATERWSRKDRPAALAWARTLPAGKTRASALEGIYRQWSEKAPREAAEAILHESASGPELDTIANLALGHWPKEDPAGALAWAARLPAEVNLANGYGILAERAGRDDPAAGAKWLETLPSGAPRDEAVARYSIQAVDRDGTAALEWAHTIADPEKRLGTMRRLTRDWFSRSPGEAYTWLQNNALLTPEEKVQVLEK